MLLSSWCIEPPTCWEHDATLRDINNYTVAMHLSYGGIIPP